MCIRDRGGTMQDTEALLYVSETSKLQIKGLMLAAILIASLEMCIRDR